MRKTRELFKKIRDMNGTFHARMGKINDRNNRNLTEGDKIKNRWQEYTEALYKIGFNDPNSHSGVTQLQPGILECGVKWALGTITMGKASGGDGFPLSYLNLVLLKMSANLENSAVATGQEKISFQSDPKEGQCQTMFKQLYICAHFTC